ncbi:MAG: TPM domain-containing protein [Bacteroidales bacterium]|nr:TPM domain-containing protein [Bacteroidales bacterium]
MGFKIRLTLTMAILLLISVSCGNKKTENYDFQVSPDVLENNEAPQMEGSITDLENIFDDNAKDRLLQKIDLMQNEYNLPIFILTTASNEPFETFTEYSDNVGSQWDYCKDEEGILFILSSFMGELRVITCTKTETKISEEDFDYMINNILYESFRNESFEEGIIKALDFVESIFSKN